MYQAAGRKRVALQPRQFVMLSRGAPPQGMGLRDVMTLARTEQQKGIYVPRREAASK